MSDEADERMEHINKLTHLWWRVDALLARLLPIIEWLKAFMTGTEIGTPKTVSDSSHSTDSSVHGSESAHVNINRFNIKVDANALSIVALIIAVAALVAVLMFQPIMDAKVEAGKAQAEATAREARTTAKVTEDKLDELRDKMNAKGMNIPPLNGH